MNEIDTQRKLMLHALNQKDYDAAVYHREKLEEAQEVNRSRKTNKPKVVEVKRKKRCYRNQTGKQSKGRTWMA